MKDLFFKIVCFIGLVGLFVSATLCFISMFILLCYTIYKLIKIKNKKLYICIILYILNLFAYCGILLDGNSLDAYFFNSDISYALGNLIGFNILGIIATCVLVKLKKNGE